MNDVDTTRPPRWATQVLRWYCKPSLVEDLEGDLNECFQRNVKHKGVRTAKFIYVIDVIKFFRLYTLRKPEVIDLLINWIMLGSYIKTTSRNIARNRLFSAINIIGLAISMSVGLLMISIMSDLFSYDDFHEKKDRTFRIITQSQFGGQEAVDLASTSVKAGRQLREAGSLTEDLTILRNNFRKDAHVDNKEIPVSGLWADDSFFKVFTFPLLSGNAANALKEPYSIVLTEKAATKMFGHIDVLGKQVVFDSLNYVVTAVMKDVPRFSQLRFEVLVSLSSLETGDAKTADAEFLNWSNVYSNFVYFTLGPGDRIETVQANLDRVCLKENEALPNQKISLTTQALKDVVLGKHLSNQIGPNMITMVVVVLIVLSLIVILSASFNYTNLSIARSIRRSREVGIRKVIGAFKSQVMLQFICESVVISLLAFVLSTPLFLFLKTQFLWLNPHIEDLLSLELSVQVVIAFAIFAVAVGMVSGFLPALFFSRIKVIEILKDASSIKMFRHVTFRKALIVTQYTFSLIFITTTIVGYVQYKHFLAFDLGFKTDNILNIYLQGHKANLLEKSLNEMPEVTNVSKSLLVSSLGSLYGETAKYKDPKDSTGVFCNVVDEKYLNLHGHQLVAGRNFIVQPNKEEREVIVNEEVLKRFNIGGGDPTKALGEVLRLEKNKNLVIVGVVKNFHYATALDRIEPFAFRYSNDNFQYVNAAIRSSDWPATFEKLELAWRQIDPVHPLDAKFYSEQIENAYSQFSVMLKIISFLAFIAICISSLGLFGMVVFTAETKLKEISIRKVLGASMGNIIFLLSKNFLMMLLLAALIALPATWFLFDKLILVNIAYHVPMGFIEFFGGFLAVAVIAFLMIGSQTFNVAQTNPSEVLKNE